jgi:hypothetical protein
LLPGIGFGGRGGATGNTTSGWTIWHLERADLRRRFPGGCIGFGRLDQYELLNKDIGLLLPFLSYAALTTTVTGWDDLRRILRIFTASVIFENVLAVGGFLAHYYFGTETPFVRYGARLSGMLLDPNAYGGLLVVALAICEGASWGPAPLFRKPALWFARVTLTLGILFTFSRSAWVALAAALLLLSRVLKVALRLVGASLMAPSPGSVHGESPWLFSNRWPATRNRCRAGST